MIVLNFGVSIIFSMSEPFRLLETPGDVKKKIIALLPPKDTSTLQLTCWEFKKSATIRAPEVFKVAIDPLWCAAEQDKIRVVLSAAAEGYYEAMENILMNQKNNRLFYSFHANCLEQFCSFDLYAINKYKKDERLAIILNKYNIPRVSDIIEFNIPIQYTPLNELIMACYAGDLDYVKSIIQSKQSMVYDTQSLLNSFVVSINHNDADCIRLLCETISSNNEYEQGSHQAFKQDFKKQYGKLLLQQALFMKYENASEALILGGCSDIDTINDYYIVLDESTEISYIDPNISSFIKRIKTNYQTFTKKITPNKKNNCAIQ
jgi:hypothetical protein